MKNVMHFSGVSRILPVFARDFVPVCARSLVLVFAQEKRVPIHREPVPIHRALSGFLHRNPCAFPPNFSGNVRILASDYVRIFASDHVLIFAQEKRIFINGSG
jgi:hypothetical protein